MIPHIIHYCWFGNKKKPHKIEKYIDEWKKLLPDYEFIEWNEENFPIDYCKYTKEAYELKKYAFVSDVARLYGLYEYGGVYLDTDIEILKRFDKYLDEAKIIFSLESSSLLMTGFMAGEKNAFIFRSLLEEYSDRQFVTSDGFMNCIANTVYLTNYMKKIGLSTQVKRQVIGDGIYIYDNTVFGAYDADRSEFQVSDETVLIHHCLASWQNTKGRTMLGIKKILANHAGGISKSTAYPQAENIGINLYITFKNCFSVIRGCAYD